MQLSKKWTALAPLVFVFKTAAVSLVGIIIGITVLVVAGVVVSKFIQFFHSPAWTNPGGSGDGTTTNTVAVYINEEDEILPWSLGGTIYPTYAITTNSSFENDLPLWPAGFTVQYGLDINSNPMVNLTGITPATLQTTTANGSNYTFSLTLDLPGMNDVLTYSSTNMMDADDTAETDLYVTNNAMTQSSTNSFGDTASISGTPQTLNLVVVQRSTNLINWTSLFTNYVSPGTMLPYIDTNAPWPRAFYRVSHTWGQ
jgi:hypothetical protein